MSDTENQTLFSERVGEALKGGTVAWELQKRANQTRNQNTRYFNFWKFVSSSILEDVPALFKSTVDLATLIPDLFLSDEDEETKKLEKHITLLKKLKEVNPGVAPPQSITSDQRKWIDDELTVLETDDTKKLDAIKARALKLYFYNTQIEKDEDKYVKLEDKYKNSVNTEIKKLKSLPANENPENKFIREQTHNALIYYKNFVFLIDQIEATTENLIKIGTNIPHKNNMLIARKITNMIVAAAPPIHNGVKKYLDYIEGRHELQVKRIETQASDAGPTTEALALIREHLRSGKDVVQWDEVSKVDSEAEMIKNLLEYRIDYYKTLRGINWFSLLDGFPHSLSQQVNDDIKDLNNQKDEAEKKEKNLLEKDEEKNKIITSFTTEGKGSCGIHAMLGTENNGIFAHANPQAIRDDMGKYLEASDTLSKEVIYTEGKESKTATISSFYEKLIRDLLSRISNNSGMGKKLEIDENTIYDNLLEKKSSNKNEYYTKLTTILNSKGKGDYKGFVETENNLGFLCQSYARVIETSTYYLREEDLMLLAVLKKKKLEIYINNDDEKNGKGKYILKATYNDAVKEEENTLRIYHSGLHFQKVKLSTN